MFGNAAGVWSASLWKRTILPFFTLLVTLWQMLSGVAVSFQSRLSPLETVGNALSEPDFAYTIWHKNPIVK